MKTKGFIADQSKVVLETVKSLDQSTLGELVDCLVRQKGLKFKDATKAVYVEWKKGTLDLTDNNRPSSLQSYFFNLESLWFWAVTSFVAVTLLFVFTVNASVLVYVRYVLGGVFVLFLPGFMIVSALYPGGGELDGLERSAFSFGLSLAIVPLVGLLLNFSPWGVRLEPIMISLAVLAEALAAICVFRRFKYHLLDFN